MSRINVIVNQFQDTDGRTLPRSEITSFEVGSATPKALFSDAALTVPLPQPIIADGAGRFFDIFVASGGYKIILSDEFQNQIWEQDNYFATVDGTDLTNLEADILTNAQNLTENIASYTDSGAADAYVLSIKGGLTAPNALIQGMKILFTPTNANTTASTVNVDSLGVIGLRLADNVTVLPSGFMQTNRHYMFEYDGSTFKYLWRSGSFETSDYKDDSITLAKMAPIAAGNVITGDSSNDPQVEVYQKRVKLADSGQLASGQFFEFTDIPTNATQIEIIGTNISDTAGALLDLTVGYGSGTPTYIVAAGDYIGNQIGVDAAADTSIVWSTNANIGMVVAGSAEMGFKVTLDKVNDGSETWAISHRGIRINGATSTMTSGFGRIKAASLVTALTAVKFTLVSGAFDDGYMTCYYYGNPDA